MTEPRVLLSTQAADISDPNGAISTRPGFTVWLTGLPGAGKTTLARLLAVELRGQGMAVELLDGDELRRSLTKDLGFSREDRLENVRRIASVAAGITRAGGIAIVAAIAPYAEARAEARTIIGRFVEIYVRCPLAVCMQRDPKGLYAKAQRGELPQFTGLPDPYEPPVNPDVVVETDEETPKQSLSTILRRLHTLSHIPLPPAPERISHLF